ncbi:MAG: lysostaphin resistance A-like protein [Eubacteriales bacterium]
MEMDKKRDLFNPIIFCIGTISVYSIIEGIMRILFSVLLTDDQYNSMSSYIPDTLMCAACLLFYIPCLYYLKKKYNIPVFDFPKEKMNAGLLIAATCIITLGVSGITSKFLEFVYAYLADTPFFKDSIQSYDDSWAGIDSESYFFVFLSVVILGPIIEELLFRGVIFNVIAKNFGNIAGVLVSGITFGIWHMELVQSIYTALLGVVIAIIYMYTRSILFPILCHCLYNLIGTLPPQLDTTAMSNFIDGTNYISMLPAVLLCIVFVIDYKKRYEIDRN